MQDKNRVKILKCSKEIVDTYGLKKLSIDNIVKKCKMSKTTFYNSFSSKRELIQNLDKEIGNKLEHQSIKDKIISVAIQELSKNTFNEINMDFIAQKIGINRSSIYRYFSNKEELLEASIINEMKNRKTRLGSIKSKKYNPILFIEKYIEYFDVYANNKYTNLLFATMIYYSKNNLNIKKSFDELRKYSVKLLADNFEEGKKIGIFIKNFNSFSTGQMLFSVMAGMNIHCPKRFSIIAHEFLNILYEKIKVK
ncbi:TetR/AcrR family transcriptional regulator [Clostridium tyrobutyricum]|uniref:TetR/AcrR family transcriptional regulator n=1 Tax=Clostridium tyrobutyricum TaxID=1519 RepID=UPI001C382973|nr:TetR/AcrR family transcriptional regulator [Clostridium tyrobutyricum]MBV4425544.1 TetR/AcrR family transcriptional regulator [Clostridium tyrobutyricum]